MADPNQVRSRPPRRTPILHGALRLAPTRADRYRDEATSRERGLPGPAYLARGARVLYAIATHRAWAMHAVCRGPTPLLPSDPAGPRDGRPAPTDRCAPPTSCRVLGSPCGGDERASTPAVRVLHPPPLPMSIWLAAGRSPTSVDVWHAGPFAAFAEERSCAGCATSSARVGILRPLTSGGVWPTSWQTLARDCTWDGTLPVAPHAARTSTVLALHHDQTILVARALDELGFPPETPVVLHRTTISPSRCARSGCRGARRGGRLMPFAIAAVAVLRIRIGRRIGECDVADTEGLCWHVSGLRRGPVSPSATGIVPICSARTR